MKASEQQLLAWEAAGFLRAPIYREIRADFDTPLSAYWKLADLRPTFLFESVQGEDTWARYSFIGLPARREFRFSRGRWQVTRDGVLESDQPSSDPLADIAHWLASARSPRVDPLPAFTGGLVGYFGYETVRSLESRLSSIDNEDLLALPDIVLLEVDELAIFDRVRGSIFLVVNVKPGDANAVARAHRRLEQLASRLRRGSVSYPEVVHGREPVQTEFVSGFSNERFRQAVERVKEYIRAGDCMQVVLSQRLSADFLARPIDVYRALRALNPSPYLFFLDFADHQIIGASPEVLVRVTEGVVTLRPIAGTRPRGRDRSEDEALAQELLADPKERAEHLMLIDLGRNDVGRIAEPGSVVLSERMTIEKYSHVMHIVSEVEGRLRKGLPAIDALRAAFPAGTLTGAPKIRAMEIIAELEPIARNVYGGAVGYLSWSGDIDTAIAIRTAVVRNGRLHVQAGAGIVADSDPQREWEETMDKGRALFRAVAEAAEGRW